MGKKKMVSVMNSGKLVWQYTTIKKVDGHNHLGPAEHVFADFDNGAPKMKMTLEILKTKNKLKNSKRTTCPRCGTKRRSSKDADVYVCPGCKPMANGRTA